MNPPESNAAVFDVFLCHNSEDKPAIREISRQLKGKNIKPWLDEEQIRPGTSWQTALGEQIGSISSAAVFVGESGFGPWQSQEIQALLSQFVQRQCPVIPVVLPSAKGAPELPWTLANLNWVDFRATDLDPLKQLIWGITGQKPLDQSHDPCSCISVSHPESSLKELLPRKDKVVIELRLPGNFDEFSEKERDKILSGLYSLLEVGEVHVTRTMAGSIRLHLELRPEDADKIYAAAHSGQLAALGIAEARLYPAIAVPPDAEQRSQLLILLDQMKETWVDGALKNSLYTEALISLGKRPMEEAVEPPWKQVVELSSQRCLLIPENRDIAKIFDATGLLLILGEPGSGKTTTLLELAANLINRAESDAKERVPIVLNLSSWRKQQPLAEWIALEMSEKYRVPLRVGRNWLRQGYLVPLLDGLDEVRTALQPDCVAAINDFIDVNEPAGVVVCCRLMEYQWLPKRLKLNGAICIEPLSSEEVSDYLLKGGSKLSALREAVDADPVLQELTQTPLMLSIMSLACQGAEGNELATHKGNSVEERRKHILTLYVKQMFRRKGTTSVGFPKEKIISWLSWLAEEMRKHSQSVFLLEGLLPSWLGTRTQRAAYGTVVALSFGAIFALTVGLSVGLTVGLGSKLAIDGLIAGLGSGLVFWASVSVGVGLGCWSESPWKNAVISGSVVALISGLMFGLIIGLSGYGRAPTRVPITYPPLEGAFYGLIFGLIIAPIGGVGVGSLNDITLVESITWNWRQFRKKTIPGLIAGLMFGLLIALIGLVNEILSMRPRYEGGVFLVIFIIVTLVYGLIFGFFFALISGLLGGLTDTGKVGKALPNQGIKLSRRNSLVVFLVTLLTLGLIGAVIGGVIGGLSGALVIGLIVGLTLGLVCGVFVGLIVGLNRGGAAVVKHYALRLILWRNGYTPLRFVPLLDQCARLVLLKKVGGGYIFVHRMLLEYFADLAPQAEVVGD